LKKVLIYFSIIFLSSLFVNHPTFGANPQPVKGRRLPVINLPIPKNPNEKMYLGLSGDGFFKIQQIKANAVLIKIFNLYCPVCQSTASAMAELYHQIENHPDLREKMKLIGIGTGNSLYEVEVFKQTHHIPFPIFPDEDYRIHKVLGEVRTPFFIGTKMNRDGSREIVHTHLGALTQVEAFMGLMLEAYGIHEEELRKRGNLATTLPNWPSSNED